MGTNETDVVVPVNVGRPELIKLVVSELRKAAGNVVVHGDGFSTSKLIVGALVNVIVGTVSGALILLLGLLLGLWGEVESGWFLLA